MVENGEACSVLHPLPHNTTKPVRLFRGRGGRARGERELELPGDKARRVAGWTRCVPNGKSVPLANASPDGTACHLDLSSLESILEHC